MKLNISFVLTALAVALTFSTSGVEGAPPGQHISRRLENLAPTNYVERAAPAVSNYKRLEKPAPTPNEYAAPGQHLSRKSAAIPTPIERRAAPGQHLSRKSPAIPTPGPVKRAAPAVTNYQRLEKPDPTRYATITTVTVTVTPTGCYPSCETPTATATLVGQIDPPSLPTGYPDYVPGLTFGVGWGHIGCETYCSSKCGDGVPTCDPSCSNKGTCGFSNHTNLYLGGLSDPANTQYTIAATYPAKSFTIPLIYLTLGWNDFISRYPHVNFDVRSWDKYGSPKPTQSFIIPRPPGSSYHTDIRLDLLALGIADVSKLEFFPWHEGSIGSGGQGPDGRVMASVKIDGDGLGGPIPYQVFTPEC